MSCGCVRCDRLATPHRSDLSLSVRWDSRRLSDVFPKLNLYDEDSKQQSNILSISTFPNPGRLKPMNVRWQKLLVKTSLWLTTEIWFNFLGIDNLADYSEFIFEKNAIVQLLHN
ncbi:MAG: hypothetical protein QNJ72_08695 [Pleurocapsa sp. MO_226.B13]|nr:hypothetical protein [Pleurocapsa sp. MO_226.B13]